VYVVNNDLCGCLFGPWVFRQEVWKNKNWHSETCSVIITLIMFEFVVVGSIPDCIGREGSGGWRGGKYICR
jgi:hypothetical protein